ncbi:MAG: aspartate 1-decarboxylase [Porticoccus sp.]|jgi:aspartate 1-decarboxylase
MRSKIHKATVTQAKLDYIGSITIDQDLIEAAGFWPNEKVLVVSNTSGARLETYILVGERGSGCICLNGAAAHLIKKDEEVIIIGFELTSEPITPTAILVDKQNRFVCDMTETPMTTVHQLLAKANS